MPMGITSENVAAKYGIDRRSQDLFAVRSHAKAAAAQAAGRFRDEIVPVATVLRDPKSGAEQRVTIAEDDGIRAGVSVEALGALKPVFKKDGSTTAGNASQVRLLCHACCSFGCLSAAQRACHAQDNLDPHYA
jgi:acetyl-CoA acyltransferase 1